MPVPKKIAMPGSILERISSGETTLYFHINFTFFYLFGFKFNYTVAKAK
jgi:hypothetical protein